MEFEWDNRKAASNYAKHRVAFEYATRVFLDPYRVMVEDTRHDYGEARAIVMGMIGHRLYVIAFTERGKTHRIISARKGNRREQEKYHQLHP